MGALGGLLIIIIIFVTVFVFVSWVSGNRGLLIVFLFIDVVSLIALIMTVLRIAAERGS